MRAKVMSDVRFGSLAALFGKFSLMSAFEGKADVGDLNQSKIPGLHWFYEEFEA